MVSVAGNGFEENQSLVLSSTVRQQYFSYVHKLLSENYLVCFNAIPPNTLLLATKEIENDAANKAFVISLYRKAISSTIDLIKRHSEEKCLFPQLGDFLQRNERCEKMCQTENEESLRTFNSQDFGLELFDSSDDEIFKQMEELFKDNIDMEDHIFNREPEQSKNSSDNSIIQIPSVNVNDSRCDPIVETSISEKSSKSDGPEQRLNPQSVQNKKYVYSKWLCVEYYNKKALREKLDRLCDTNAKLHRKVKNRYIDLFGYQTDDEQDLESPNTSIDFVRSCRQRIASWVTRHMRPYFFRNRMPKHLFHPLAKHLIYRIVQMNDFPDDYQVYLYIKDYFKQHQRIKCQADF